MLLREERELVVEHCRMMSTRGLTRGTGGNISALNRERMLFAISPSGMDYFLMQAEDVVVLDLEGKITDGVRKPSSELDMHRLLYADREDINAVVHTHSTYATTLACLHWSLPAVHYLIGFSGGDEVRCTPYAPFGSSELARIARDAMKGRFAVLLGNHGLLAAGPDMRYAFNAAEETEFVCELYYRAKTVGDPVLLGPDDMKTVLGKFKTYGQRS
jgi:L-fuculose-phosphate aldolase